MAPRKFLGLGGTAADLQGKEVSSNAALRAGASAGCFARHWVVCSGVGSRLPSSDRHNERSFPSGQGGYSGPRPLVHVGTQVDDDCFREERRTRLGPISEARLSWVASRLGWRSICVPVSRGLPCRRGIPGVAGRGRVSPGGCGRGADGGNGWSEEGLPCHAESRRERVPLEAVGADTTSPPTGRSADPG